MSSTALISLKKISVSEYKEKESSIAYGISVSKKLLVPIIILFLTIITSVVITLSYIKHVNFIIRITLQIFIVIASHILSTYKCFKNFKGVNGDVSGYAICISECIGYIFIALV